VFFKNLVDCLLADRQHPTSYYYYYYYFLNLIYYYYYFIFWAQTTFGGQPIFKSVDTFKSLEFKVLSKIS
jgi:hypothetical protein